jgi:hypothetical protein
MDLFCKATGMKINLEKSTLSLWGIPEQEMNYFSQILPFKLIDLDMGLKYLGFHLKPNMYKKNDWQWLTTKVEKKINTWCNRWISRGGHLVLVKVVLEAIPVFWMSMAWIPKGVLEVIRKLCYRYIWSGDNGKKRVFLWLHGRN